MTTVYVKLWHNKEPYIITVIGMVNISFFLFSSENINGIAAETEKHGLQVLEGRYENTREGSETNA